jgi:oligopeptide/dipeptide ABC transporter ATP-binding protein
LSSLVVPGGQRPLAWWRLVVQRPISAAGLAMLGLALAAAAVGSWLEAGPDPARPYRVDDVFARPSRSHLWGTDDAGNDVLRATLRGARVSLVVGCFASLIAIAVGGSVGLAAGYCGGRTERVLMRCTDVMLVIPDLPLAVVLVALTRPNLLTLILVIGLLGWTSTARLIRAQTLVIKQRRFVLRAVALGAGHGHIVRWHVLPLLLPLLVANTALVMALAIVNESTLSFLGLGDPTAPSWGQMLSFAFSRGAMSAGAWWALAAPGLGIVWVVAGCTLLGRGLEEALNPRQRTHHLSAPQHRTPATGPKSAQPGPATTASMALALRQVSIEFGRPPQAVARVVDHVDLDLPPGHVLGLVGESGCGKTSLGLATMGLLPPQGRVADGQAWSAGRDLLALGEADLRQVRWLQLAMVFQGAMNALNPVQPVRQQVAEAVARRYPRANDGERQARAADLLQQVGVATGDRARYPHQLSGGQRQRVMLAMALGAEPRVLIADEPTTALDVVVQAQILALLRRLHEERQLSVLLITHDLGVVAETCTSVAVMYAGQVVETGRTDAVLAHPLHPYTRALRRACPEVSQPEGRLAAIAGTPPDPGHRLPGCRFAPRCPQVQPQCHEQPPGLSGAGSGRQVRCHCSGSA